MVLGHWELVVGYHDSPPCSHYQQLLRAYHERAVGCGEVPHDILGWCEMGLTVQEFKDKIDEYEFFITEKMFITKQCVFDSHLIILAF